ncbi:M23 family metallopeptidase [bacterium]|nr:M23 family metallopeptidase [bacterium]
MAFSKNKYSLPCKKKDIITIVSDPRAHSGVLKYAVDFIVPEGTTVYAAHKGEVVEVKVDSKEGGDNPKFNNLKYLNYILIEHPNNEFSEYSHLQYKGALVKVGEKVKEGQPIGISGNTGLTTQSHLHFHVIRKTKNGWRTVRIRFKKRIYIHRRPK